jgi:hypothetical protein
MVATTESFVVLQECLAKDMQHTQYLKGERLKIQEQYHKPAQTTRVHRIFALQVQSRTKTGLMKI